MGPGSPERLSEQQWDDLDDLTLLPVLDGLSSRRVIDGWYKLASLRLAQIERRRLIWKRWPPEGWYSRDQEAFLDLHEREEAVKTAIREAVNPTTFPQKASTRGRAWNR